MGQRVLQASLDLDEDPGDFGGLLRVYVHAGPPASPWALGQSLGVLLINLSTNSTLPVDLRGLLHAWNEHSTDTPGAGTVLAWTLEPGDAGAGGQDVLMNGQLLPQSIGDGQSITDAPVPGRHIISTELHLPPTSVTFAAVD